MSRSRWYPLVGLALVLAGVTGLVLLAWEGPGGTLRGDVEVYSSSGQRIFLTGVGSDGPIAFNDGAFWLRMHGGGCATCHGADGRGGRPMMLNVLAPDIRYSALTQPHNEHGAYDDALIARAITSGLDADGNPLDPAMPRWRMSADDLAEVIAYLKTLR